MHWKLLMGLHWGMIVSWQRTDVDGIEEELWL